MELNIDKNWTLFLDRDGVINKKRENDYVKNWSEFLFLEGAVEAISGLSKVFGNIIIVTNQRGVGKGVMTEFELNFIHDQMLETIVENSGRIDKIYYCTDVLDSSNNRKPNIGMAKNAKIDFPKIDFKKSIIVGDSLSDMVFGEKAGMIKVLIDSESISCNYSIKFDYRFQSLFSFLNYVLKQKNET